MALQFIPAVKKALKGRMAIIGPTGSGKTYTALAIATAMCKKVAVADTESKSASKYADLFKFDVIEMDEFSPQTYIAVIEAAEAAGYDGLVIDSLSHAWSGKGGALEMVDNVAKRTNTGNNFAAWREVTPWHNKMIDKMIRSKLHLFVTMRSKMEYVMEKDAGGRTTVKKVGLQPIQREGMEYEFDVVGDVNTEHDFVVTKTRCPQLDGRVYQKAGKDVASIFAAWLDAGIPMPVQVPIASPVDAFADPAIVASVEKNLLHPGALSGTPEPLFGEEGKQTPEAPAASAQTGASPVSTDQYNAFLADVKKLSLNPMAVKKLLVETYKVKSARELSQGQYVELMSALPSLKTKAA
jgi:hypothetical protein